MIELTPPADATERTELLKVEIAEDDIFEIVKASGEYTLRV